MNNLYVDGGVVGKNPSTIGITWAYVITDDTGIIRQDSGNYRTSKAFPVLGNNTAELLAMVTGMLALPHGWQGTIYSDSANTIGRVSKGWACNNVPEWLLLLMRKAKNQIDIKSCAFVQLDGHPTKDQLLRGVGKRGNPVSRYNVLCDELCTQQARMVLESVTCQNEKV